jgi:hypothetical protein
MDFSKYKDMELLPKYIKAGDWIWSNGKYIRVIGVYDDSSDYDNIMVEIDIPDGDPIISSLIVYFNVHVNIKRFCYSKIFGDL